MLFYNSSREYNSIIKKLFVQYQLSQIFFVSLAKLMEILPHNTCYVVFFLDISHMISWLFHENPRI